MQLLARFNNKKAHQLQNTKTLWSKSAISTEPSPSQEPVCENASGAADQGQQHRLGTAQKERVLHRRIIVPSGRIL